MEFSIRLATISDLELIAHLGRKTFYEAYTGQMNETDLQTYVNEAFQLEPQRQQLEDPKRTTWIASAQGSLAGYCSIVTTDPHPSVKPGYAIKLHRLYLVQGFAGSGLAQKLFNLAIQEARTQGASCAWLTVWEKNARAIRFYERNGFLRVGTGHFRLGNTVNTDAIMELSLGPYALLFPASS